MNRVMPEQWDVSKTVAWAAVVTVTFNLVNWFCGIAPAVFGPVMAAAGHAAGGAAPPAS